jgi:HAE1 family hydrophobic/amphiphilic exporter-1
MLRRGNCPRISPASSKINPADAPVLILGVQSQVLPITQVDDAAENILAQQICA